MILVTVAQKKNTVCSLPSVLDGLADMPKNMQAHAEAMKKLFNRYAENGRQGLTKAIFHEVDQDSKIWQFSHGRIRVFCFMDGGALLVLAAVGLKKGQKVDPAKVRDAAQVRTEYLNAKQENLIQFNNLEQETST